MKVFQTLAAAAALIGIALPFGAAPARAADGFQFKTFPVTLIGNGCPPGTAQAVLNGDTLSISFARFEAIAAKPKVVSKSCNLRAALNIPSGVNVQPIQVKYLGFADIPSGGSGALNVKVLFQGQDIASDNTNFAAGFSSAFERNVNVTLGTINACKNPVASVFGVNTNITARAKNIGAGEETQVRIDTIDASFGPVLYRIKFLFHPC
jgi:hypothetical protein